MGQDLRAARLRRGDEIAAVSRALKIRKDHLEALEEDRVEDLPGRTYALGFVRSYAQYLGLDANELAERYKHDMTGRSDDSMQPAAPIHQDDRRLPQGWIIVGVILALLLGYGAWHLLSGRGDSGQAAAISQPLEERGGPLAAAPDPGHGRSLPVRTGTAVRPSAKCP